jgi:hypothetical protein
MAGEARSQLCRYVRDVTIIIHLAFSFLIFLLSWPSISLPLVPGVFFTSKSVLQHYAESTQWLLPRLIKRVSYVTGRCSSEGLAGKRVQVSLHVHTRTLNIRAAQKASDLAILSHFSAEDHIEDIMIRYSSLRNVTDYRLDG